MIDKIKISEIFCSIQGEGRNVGKPAIFIRFFGCNLDCIWCDTKYSYHKDYQDYKLFSIEDIITEIEKFNVKHIIFTGGEPMLFQNIIFLLQEKLNGYTFELETNGSITFNYNLKFEQVNISPKLSNSLNNKYSLNILNKKNDNIKNIDLKFVAENKKDLEEIDNFLKGVNLSNIGGIYIMPIGTTKESQLNNIVLDYCIKRNYNYCVRLHILLFGDKRGV